MTHLNMNFYFVLISVTLMDLAEGVAVRIITCSWASEEQGTSATAGAAARVVGAVGGELIRRGVRVANDWRGASGERWRRG